MRTLLDSYRLSRQLAPQTLAQYEIAIHHWEGHFGTAMPAEISAVDLGRFTVSLLSGRQPATANKIVRHVLALIRWGVEIGELPAVPAWRPLREPRRAPVAFLASEFQPILATAREWPGWICGIPDGAWWESLLLATWYSGARIGAVLAVTWPDVLENGFFVRAPHQKQAADQFFVIGSDAIEALDRARQPARELVWPWPYRRQVIYRQFRRIAAEAGVTLDRTTGCCFHRIRKSTASYLHASGGDATSQLGHSASSVTRRYFDPRICGAHDATRAMPKL